MCVRILVVFFYQIFAKIKQKRHEIKEEEEAHKLIETILADLNKIIKINTPYSEPQEDLNRIKFDEDHTRDMLDTYAQIVKKKR